MTDAREIIARAAIEMSGWYCSDCQDNTIVHLDDEDTHRCVSCGGGRVSPVRRALKEKRT